MTYSQQVQNMWPFNLSVRLPIVALVGHYLTN